MRHTKRYLALRYNPDLKERAKQLRKAGMLHKALMWNQLKRNKLNGLDFDRQKIIGNYIVDFYCAEKAMVLEIDGSSHDGREDYDRHRQDFLKSQGLTVVPISVIEVLQNMAEVVRFLRDHPGLAATPSKEEN